MFEVGQEVVYLGAEMSRVDPCCLPGGYWCPNWPEKGRHYHIRSVEVTPDVGECVRLVEVENPVRPFDGSVSEAQFTSRWFAPIEKKQYSIEVFTALLNPINHKVTEDA